MTIDYGIDVSLWNGKDPPDLDPYFTLITGNRLLAEVALRRVFCLPGSYTQVPGFKSIDLIALLNSAQDKFDDSALSEQASAAIRADERFDPAHTSATVTFANEKLTAQLNLAPSQSAPFQLTVKVSKLLSPSPLFEIAFPLESP